MDGKPRRPFWRQKRTWAAAYLLAMVVYPLSACPVAYASGRRWIEPESMAFVYTPVEKVMMTIAEAGQSRTFKASGVAGGPVVATPARTARPGWLLRTAASGVDAFGECVGWCYEAGERHAG